MNSSIRVLDRKQSASLRTVLSIVTIVPLWLMLAAAPTSTLAQAQASPADWTEFHRDNMQRWNPYETMLSPSNVASLQVKWQNSIGTFGFHEFQSSPTVVNGAVYFGDDDFNVYALSAATGAKLWSFATGNPVLGSPAVANGVVYIGSDDSNVYALNAASGAKLWSFATRAGVESSPTVVNGVVYVGSDDGNVYALNAGSGAKLWSFAAGNTVRGSPAVANGMVYVGSLEVNNGNLSGHVSALNATTGAKLWSFATATGSVDSSPAVANGTVYVTSFDNNLYALDATTGAKLWSFAEDLSSSSPAVANGVVYVGGPANPATGSSFYALNATTGALLWSFAAGYVFSSPAVANGVVYVGSDSLYALNATTGAKLWSFANAGEWRASPSIVDGVLYARSGSSSGSMAYAFGLGAGSADLFLRIIPSTTTVHQGDLLTFAFPVWNLGPDVAEGEVLSSLQVPVGTTFDYVRISGTPGLGTCTHPPYGGTGQIICHEGDGMAPNTTWTVRLTVKVTAPAGTVITESAATMSDTPDPNLANNMATVSIKVQ